jgi:hypothetical protein
MCCMLLVKFFIVGSLLNFIITVIGYLQISILLLCTGVKMVSQFFTVKLEDKLWVFKNRLEITAC